MKFEEKKVQEPSATITEVVRSIRVDMYEIRGNQEVAITINANDPRDSHYFIRDPDYYDDAFLRACAWAYPGA